MFFVQSGFQINPRLHFMCASWLNVKSIRLCFHEPVGYSLTGSLLRVDARHRRKLRAPTPSVISVADERRPRSDGGAPVTGTHRSAIFQRHRGAGPSMKIGVDTWKLTDENHHLSVTFDFQIGAVVSHNAPRHYSWRHFKPEVRWRARDCFLQEEQNSRKYFCGIQRF